ncbi:Uncharacterised protein [Legionella hackeliae]|nr:hypothetical protein Lhac_1965 [Legionella hackeliae]STX47834.1 Uncharacterised protein [Legionella hackeliae]
MYTEKTTPQLTQGSVREKVYRTHYVHRLARGIQDLCRNYYMSGVVQGIQVVDTKTTT